CVCVFFFEGRSRHTRLVSDWSSDVCSSDLLADDLCRYLAGEPIHARRAGTVERVIAWARRRPAVAALAGVSALAALALVGVVVKIGRASCRGRVESVGVAGA